MSGEGSSIRIPQFNGKNFGLWKKQVTVTLKMKGLINVLDQVEDAKKDDVWQKKDNEALAILLTSVEQTVALKVQSCETAADIWNRLREVYESTNVALVAKVFEEYYSYRKSAGDDMATHVSKVEALASHLETVGQKQTEVSIMSRLLYSLPSTYNSLKEAWESVSSEKQTRAALVSRLLSHSPAEEAQHKDVALIANDQSSSGMTQGQRDGKKRFNGKCYNCGKIGHFAKDCKSKPRQDGIALVARQGDTPNDKIYIDSGASKHTIRHKHWFSTMTPWKEQLQVGNKEWVESLGRGTVTLRCRVGSREEIVTLHDVLYIPTISHNLFSTGRASERGAITTFSKKGCEIRHSGRVIAQGWQLSSGLYYLDARAIGGSAMIADDRRSLADWHRALGHADTQTLAEMANNECVRGMQIVKPNNDGGCSNCAEGKGTRASHTLESSFEPTEVGQRVDLDLIGPINQESLGKKRYILLAKDRYSDYSHIYMLNNKTEVAEKLQHYIGVFESESSYRLREIHTDNGSEFANSQVRTICDLEHVNLTFSAPYVPEQNGTAERNNRTIIETIRTILSDSCLPKALWAEAANTAVYLRNRIAKRGSSSTPYERFWGRKPYVGHLVPFGTEVHSLITDRNLGKFDAKTEESYIIGFTDRVSNYRILVKSTMKVKISCDIIFRPHSNQNRQKIDLDASTDVIVSVGGQKKSNLSQYFDELMQTMTTGARPTDKATTSGSIEKFVTANAGGDLTATSEVESPSFSDITVRGNQSRPTFNSPPVDAPSFGSNLRQSTPIATASKQMTPSGLTSHEATSRVTSASRRLSYPQLDVEPSPFRGRELPRTPQHQNSSVAASQEQRSGGVITRAISKQLGKLLVIESSPSANEPKTYQDAIAGPNNGSWKAAIQAELDAHASNGTWTVVERPGTGTVLSAKWVFKIKRDEVGNIEKFKARLVARGFQQREGRDYIEDEIYAPVARCESIRTLLAISQVKNLQIERFDVSTAFLNGKIESATFVDAPEGVNVGHNQCLKLEKALYGLKQAPKAWHSTFDKAVIDMGFSRIISDSCVYFLAAPLTYLSIYVDDGLVISDSQESCRLVIERLNNCFVTNRVSGEIFLGIQIRNSPIGLHLSQRRYIEDLLRRFNMSDCSGYDRPLVDTKMLFGKQEDIRTDVPYRSAIGGLQYLALCTRPDILYPTILLSRFNDKPQTKHWAAVKRVMSYLKRTADLGLYFKSLQSAVKLDVYSDADWAGDEETRRSTSGVLITLSGSPIIFVSRQQTTVAQSSTEAELIAANEAVKELMWLINFLRELKIEHEKPILHVDNKSTIALIKNNDIRRRSKHVDVKYHLVREKLSEGLFVLEYINTKEQLADFLTKPLGSNQLKDLIYCSNLMSARDAGFEGECYDGAIPPSLEARATSQWADARL